MPFAPAAISVDVEDWPQSTWDRQLPITPRAARNTRRLLEIFAQSRATATMFVLGRFAETFPDVVREMHAAGHEIASHGYGHDEVYRLSPVEFRDDLRRSKDLLEDITGQRVVGYRAPDFSINGSNVVSALETLAECGFEYDSSIFPIRGPRYGIPGWPSDPVAVLLPSGRSLIECPVATLRRFGRNWPVGGGGYSRLLPGSIARWAASQVLMERPFVFYCHPYELDHREFQELSLPIPWGVRWHQGAGRRFFEGRLLAFIARFGSRTVRDVARSREWASHALAPREATTVRDSEERRVLTLDS